MILLLDNYDSFVHNLARYVRRLGCETMVVRNDAATVDELLSIPKLQGIILSPGPCTPNQAGCSLELVRQLPAELPILGVCLGHQTIGQAFGGTIIRAPEPCHGRAAQIEHTGDGLFTGWSNPAAVGRYHSLVIDPQSIPRELQVTARTNDGIIMAVAHIQRPIYGVQFHPESVLTPFGYRLMANFLRRCGAEIDDVCDPSSEELPSPVKSTPLPSRPVTF